MSMPDVTIGVDPIANLLGFATLVLTLLAQRRNQEIDPPKKIPAPLSFRNHRVPVWLPVHPGGFD
jgi:hypothetical protein